MNDSTLTSSLPECSQPSGDRKDLNTGSKSGVFGSCSSHLQESFPDNVTCSGPAVTSEVIAPAIANELSPAVQTASSHCPNGASSKHGSAAASHVSETAGRSLINHETNGRERVPSTLQVSSKTEPLDSEEFMQSLHVPTLEKDYNDSTSTLPDENRVNPSAEESPKLANVAFNGSGSDAPKSSKELAHGSNDSSSAKDLRNSRRLSHKQVQKPAQKRNSDADSKVVKCLVCGVRLDRRSSSFLKILHHVQTHCRSRYVCQACEYTSPRLDSMRRHVEGQHKAVTECNDTADMDLVAEWKQQFKDCFPVLFKMHEDRFVRDLI